MNKSQLITALSDSQDIRADEASSVINSFIDSIKQALASGGRVEIRGFGSFKVKDYKGYTGRNPKSGNLVKVHPKRLPFFRPGKQLKEYLNKK